MKKSFQLLFLVSLFFFAGCAALKEKKEYKKTMTSYYAYPYEQFLKKYPNSQYAGVVKDSLYQKQATNSWNYALRMNDVPHYEDFIKKYPGTKYIPLANQKISDLNEKKDYEDFKIKYTIESLQAFLNKYPESTHKAEIEAKLKEEKAWEYAKASNTVPASEEYLASYPEGKYQFDAKTKINELKTILPEWEIALKTNTEKGYKDFLSKYPNSGYAVFAKEYVKKYEDEAWNKALAKNTLKGYNDFIAKYPNGSHKEEAEKKIVDFEVEGIFAGSYGALPSGAASKSGNEKNVSDDVTVRVKNDTEYQLTVWYSGNATSKKAVLAPHDSTSIELKQGKYRVAAQIKAKNVDSYAGNSDYQGGYSYDQRFYISHEYKWNYGR